MILYAHMYDTYRAPYLPQADYGRLPERLLLSVKTKSINENFVNRKLRPLLFL